MKNMNIINILLISMLISVFIQSSLFSNDLNYQWQIGEELTYKVKWSFIRLGTVRLNVVDSLQLDGKFVYHVKLFIDSNPLIFFVNMHGVYDSYIDKKFRLHLFIADERVDKIPYKAEYKFDYSKNLIHVVMTNTEDTTQVIQKILPLADKTFDGSAMIFYARAHIHDTKTDTLTSFFEAKTGKVVISFKGRKGNEKIGALDYPLDTYFVDGVVRMKGIAGLTGPYKGWFAIDKQRPPLKAELKVFIGHVSVELESWKDWSPLREK